jgi:hypothetical protein
MKDTFITFVIGLAMLAVLSIFIVLVLSTSFGLWILFGFFILVASYVIGNLAREVWRLKKI